MLLEEKCREWIAEKNRENLTVKISDLYKLTSREVLQYKYLIYDKSKILIGAGITSVEFNEKVSEKNLKENVLRNLPELLHKPDIKKGSPLLEFCLQQVRMSESGLFLYPEEYLREDDFNLRDLIQLENDIERYHLNEVMQINYSHPLKLIQCTRELC